MKLLHISGELGAGKSAMLDTGDYRKQSKYKWYWDGRHISRINYLGVKNGKIMRKKVYLHREIMLPPEGYVVDHINHDGLDNRRSNLRICTQTQNMANMRKMKHSSQRYKGVVQACKNRWYAHITVNDERHYFTYRTELEAAVARDNIAEQIHGEYAYKNISP